MKRYKIIDTCGHYFPLGTIVTTKDEKFEGNYIHELFMFYRINARINDLIPTSQFISTDQVELIVDKLNKNTKTL